MVAALADETEVCLHLDPDRNGVMWNWNQAVQCVNSDVAAGTDDWHFIVQDDMIPYTGWQDHLRRATLYSPARMLGLVWVGVSWNHGGAMRVPYMTGPYALRGGAIAYHRSLFPDFARFAEYACQTDYPNDDIAAAIYLQAVRGEEPALTSHTLFDSPRVKSMLRHATYDTGEHTLETMGTLPWSVKPRSIRVNNGARKADVRQLLGQMKKLGWTR